MRPQNRFLEFRLLPYRLKISDRRIFQHWIWILMMACLASQTGASDMLDEDLNVEPAHDNSALTTLRFAMDGGYSRWLYSPDSISSGFKNFLGRLTTGFAGSAEADFFFLPRGGVGLQSIWYLSNATAEGIKFRDKDALTHDLREHADFFYVGPEFLARQRLSQHTVLIAGFGVGYMHFSQTELNDGVTYRLASKNYGLVASLSGDYLLHRYLALGISGRFVFSNFRDYTVNGVPVHIRDVYNQYMWDNVPMERLELVAGLRFML